MGVDLAGVVLVAWQPRDTSEDVVPTAIFGPVCNDGSLHWELGCSLRPPLSSKCNLTVRIRTNVLDYVLGLLFKLYAVILFCSLSAKVTV